VGTTALIRDVHNIPVCFVILNVTNWFVGGWLLANVSLSLPLQSVW